MNFIIAPLVAQDVWSDWPAVLLYFLFGAAGTALHLAVSPVLQFGFNRQTVARTAMGAAVGVVLPYVGGAIGERVGVPGWIAGELPMLVKGFAIFIMSLGGSYVLGDIIARRAIAKAGNGKEGKP